MDDDTLKRLTQVDPAICAGNRCQGAAFCGVFRRGWNAPTPTLTSPSEWRRVESGARDAESAVRVYVCVRAREDEGQIAQTHTPTLTLSGVCVCVAAKEGREREQQR
eukprot:555177-Rhodomonas_salina.1